MNILIMMDSFKGSISSIDAGNTLKEAIKKDNSDYDIKVLPVADGGEGTVISLLGLENMEKVEVEVYNPNFEKVIATYGLDRVKNLAIMEMSEASGLTLIKDKLNPMGASTYGVGQMILDALVKGAREFIIGIGGSATNDGGIGMLEALSVEFLDDKGSKISPGIRGVADLETIDISKMDKRLKEVKFNIACDVDNPLNGEKGSAHVYGPQKGASSDEVNLIDKYLLKYHKLTKDLIKDADNTYPGVGAAGGLGYGFKHYLNANLSPGIDLIMDLLKAEDYIKEADLVITGEGKIDFQTAMGKTPVGVAKLAKKYNKPVIALGGVCENDANILNEKGIDAFFPILDKLSTLDEAMDVEKTKENLSRSIRQIINVLNIRSKYE